MFFLIVGVVLYCVGNYSNLLDVNIVGTNKEGTNFISNWGNGMKNIDLLNQYNVQHIFKYLLIENNFDPNKYSIYINGGMMTVKVLIITGFIFLLIFGIYTLTFILYFINTHIIRFNFSSDIDSNKNNKVIKKKSNKI